MLSLHQEEDLLLLRELESMADGDFKYYIYEPKASAWYFIGRGHAPPHLIDSPAPPEFSKYKELPGLIRKIVFRKLHLVVDALGNKLNKYCY